MMEVKMVTASHIAKKIVSQQPFVEEGLGEGIISIGNLAEQMLPAIEKEMGKKVRLPAIVMALRRHSEEMQEHRKKMKAFDYTGELIMKTNICDVNVVNSQNSFPEKKY